MTINRVMGVDEWSMLVVLSVLWGGSFFFVELIVHDMTPLAIVTLRVALAAPALWCVIAILRIPLPSLTSVWRDFLGMGLLNNVIPFLLIVWGQTQIASGLASILNATTPIFSVLVAGWLLADERITKLGLVGVGFGFLGVCVLVGRTAFDGVGDDLAAQIAVLGAALSYAFAAVFGRRFRAKQVHPIVTAAGQVTASAVMLLCLSLVFGEANQLIPPGLVAFGAIMALAFLSTALAYILYFRILAASGATNILLVTFLVPVSAILLGSLVLGERLAATHFVGMVLIGIGLSAIDGRLWRWKRGRGS